VSSIAFDCTAPIVDGNVARVLCRLDRIRDDPRAAATVTQLWRRSDALLPGKRCGDFNSALMELGAPVCMPRAPKCLLCPVREHCAAHADGVQEQIPPPRPARQTPRLRRDVLCIRNARGAWLIEQRPAKGRWAGMWQFVTVPSDGRPWTARRIGAELGLAVTSPRPVGTLEHALTHRKYHFSVIQCQLVQAIRAGSGQRWTSLDRLDRYPLPRPHLKIAQMLRDRTASNENRFLAEPALKAASASR
jgi:A/G-specific adenine glycosylase